MLKYGFYWGHFLILKQFSTRISTGGVFLSTYVFNMTGKQIDVIIEQFVDVILVWTTDFIRTVQSKIDNSIKDGRMCPYDTDAPHPPLPAQANRAITPDQRSGKVLNQT